MKLNIITKNEEYGKIIPNLKINGVDALYGVVNERAIRAGAGIMLMLGLFAFSQALYLGNRIPLFVIVPLFFIDFLIKVVHGPRYSPISNIANLIVKKQKPEYTGAIQKRFAWSIGLVMATTMMILIFGFNVQGLFPFVFCSICLLFMFFETSFGICVGCKIYWGLISIGIIKEPDIRPACPGGACPIPKKIKNKNSN